MHRCPAPACKKMVPSNMFACGRHWYVLPLDLRNRIWRAYRAEPGGDEHREAMDEAERFLIEVLP